MFNLFENAQTRLNDVAEGFGYFTDIRLMDEVLEIPGIKAGSYQTVMFKPLCGLFNQSKYIPLRYMPIEIELELADNEAPIITTFTGPFTNINTSTS
jgi:hypothetical protein